MRSDPEVDTDEGLIGEYDSLGAEIKAYGWKPGSIWSTDPLFLKENGQYYFYHNDHLGTPQQLTSVGGAVVWKAKYNSFGKAFVDSDSSVVSSLRFGGQFYDSETGLYYNRHRYYSPDQGRFLRTDPIGLAGGISLYSYVINNPNNLLDPLGLRGDKYPTFYDVFSKDFLKKFKQTNPVEHYLFEQYAKNIRTGHWPSNMLKGRPFDDTMLIVEIGYFLDAWSGFECYARDNARSVLNERVVEFYRSQYGSLALLGKLINSLEMIISSDVGTAIIAKDLEEESMEVANLITPWIGPEVINSKNIFTDHGYFKIHLFYAKIMVDELRKRDPLLFD